MDKGRNRDFYASSKVIKEIRQQFGVGQSIPEWLRMLTFRLIYDYLSIEYEKKIAYDSKEENRKKRKFYKMPTQISLLEALGLNKKVFDRTSSWKMYSPEMKLRQSRYKACPTVKKRVEHIREFRLASKAEGTRKFAATPTLFCQIAQPNSDYIIVPETSSGKRRYIPLGFMSSFVIASNLVFLIPNAGLYEFGVLMSNVHNSWMRLVAGRLKSDFRYAKDIVYNNFIWCEPTPEQKAKIEQTAQGILDARALYPKSSLSKLYDENFMPPELRRAHQLNDKAVMEAYGFTRNTDAYKSESACVAALMKLYKEKTQG